ncbi:hypothetical protein [Saccharopolyspora pogona]|uniref:hypothetical protein n=1 Tax=Saccharopolyspora pogona TaxID=333966 RepID=UPI001CC240E5|nr:hypothetical protein [Saccharopolyspora pogona]
MLVNRHAGTRFGPGFEEFVAEQSTAGRGEVINGQTTIELLGDEEVIPLTGPVRFWVSEGTYLPVRYQQQNSDGTWSAPADFTWLPPTGENLAQLKAAVPEGFTQLPSHP